MASTPALPTDSSQNATGPYQDPAEGILRGDTSITDEDRASLWDAFHNSKSPNELAQKLQPLGIPSDTKHKLWAAKQATAPVASPVDKVTEALNRLKQIDPDTLAVAEKFPTVAKAFIDAAVKPAEKAAGEAGAPAGKAESAGKGKTAKEEKPRLIQAPRADGQPHLPPIAEGSYRILSSDGGVHDIPQERIQDAKNIDPNLHILNP